MCQQLWEYKVEEKLYLGVREQKRLNITVLSVTKQAWNKLQREHLTNFTNSEV
jgi:hypothetical protein